MSSFMPGLSKDTVELMSRDNAHLFIFVKVEKIRVPTHKITCAPLQCSNQIFVIIRIFLDRPDLQTAFSGLSNQRKGDDPTINLLSGQGKIPSNAWIIQTASNFLKDCSGPNKMKRLIV